MVIDDLVGRKSLDVRDFAIFDGIADDDIRSANFMSVGFNYFENHGIDIIEGRALSEGASSA